MEIQLHMPLTLLQPCALRLTRFVFFVAVSLSFMAFRHCNGVCQVFKCGNYSLDFPFGQMYSGCGDPALQLACDDPTGMPLITIAHYQYYILEPHNYSSSNYSYPTMVLLYKQFHQDPCNFSEGVYDQFWSAQQHFHIDESEYTNMTLGKSCSTGSYGGSTSGLTNSTCNQYHYFSGALADLSSSCASDFRIAVNKTELDLGQPLPQIIEKGVTMVWTASEDCAICETDSRNCTHLTYSSFCYCDAMYAMSYSKCSVASGPGQITRRTKTGIAVGLCVLIMGLVLLLILVYKKRSFHFQWIQTSVAAEPMNSGSVGSVENFLQNYIHQMPTRYSFSQLKKITNNFADKLGEGGFGVVYKGKLRSGSFVAVKLLDQSRQSESQFMNEVATLGTIHHFHLVRLMGYCFESFRSALVYEYMANGSLEKFIFQGKEKEEEQKLSWDQLYSIALGAARGIAYLHEECSRRIIHFDIKPHNILLDADFTAKVADFGLAKLYEKAEDHVSITATRGTPGYVAPELCNRDLGPVTDKSDVYSFGMLLLEIVGRRKNIELQVSRSSQVYFPDWAFKLIESGELERRLRERLGRGEMEGHEDEEKVRRLAKVGMWCIQYNSIDRPSMSRVVQMLEGNGDDVSNPPKPFNSASASQSILPIHSDEFSSTM